MSTSRLRNLAIAIAIAAIAVGTLGTPAVHTALTDARPAASHTTQATDQRTTSAGASLRDDFDHDFNGDGYADLVTATPKAPVNGQVGAGSVVVLYGSANGVAPSRSATLTQATTGVPGSPEAGDGFGSDVASGDLDGDGYDDLVVASSGEKAADGSAGTGSVTVLWGGSQGLTNGGTAVPDDRAGVPVGDPFGIDVAVADIDGDQGQNLIVLTGTSLVPYADGFTRTAPSAAMPVTDSVRENPHALATGDFTGSGSSDIVVYGSQDADETSGAWTAVYSGGPAGVEFQRELTNGASAVPESAAVGDFDKDGRADLVTGSGTNCCPDSVDDPSASAGQITVYYGAQNGLGTGRRPVLIHQGTAGVPGADEWVDHFGAALAAGDVTDDGYADLAVGVPGEEVDGVAGVGSVVLLKGGASGLTGTGAQALHQDTTGVPGAGEKDDHFGSALRATDLNGDGRADVAISARGEDVTPGATADGAVWALRGARGGITTTGATSFSAPKFGFTYTDSEFGSVLAN
ncbi:FG-GAP repeat protein [Streptomyces sp. ME19-01-6]|uniref:FG-GAP repeat protein n=1 Tax=Streptomyces sp. ME19-01-6 TaxID=3028686 RepID=UPI0029A3A542|nr:FG-GAP repeat protein [Streptomyces sp. ME19-01-6]MDX3226664.1 FG-GAP repeat protein [Streptomyces sp. ME19-01-6]